LDFVGVIFGWVVPNFAFKNLFRHVFQKSCSAMAKEKLEEKVQQYDQDGEESKTGCRRP